MTDEVADAAVGAAPDVDDGARHGTDYDPGVEAAAEHAAREAHGRGALVDSLRTIAFAFLLALTLRVVVMEPFHIPSASMEPALYPGDTIGAAKFPYGWSRVSTSPIPLPMIAGRVFGRDPRRGDIIVFRNELDGGADYIKRVVGLPGDRVQMRGGVLHLNGEAVPTQLVEEHDGADPYGAPVRVSVYEERLPDGCAYHVQHFTYPDGRIEGLDDTYVYEVPEGRYFVMGDNRDASYDSRWQGRVGFVPASDVIGRAQFVFVSFGANGANGAGRWPNLRGERTLKTLPCS